MEIIVIVSLLQQPRLGAASAAGQAGAVRSGAGKIFPPRAWKVMVP